MAIWLTTGLPGHGKTLRTIVDVEERRIKEGRPVYYHGIPELKLDWHELADPFQWHLLPDGAIIVIDEAQQTFPVRPSGARVPEHVSPFETHRHRGHDVVLVTQHPHLIDAHVRKLVERHQHVMRPFGHSYAVVYEWQVCVDPQRRGVEKDALKSRWKYPKDAFGAYKSASVHTVRKRLPGKLLLLPLLGVLLGLLLWVAQSQLSAGDTADTMENAARDNTSESVSLLGQQRPVSNSIRQVNEPYQGYELAAIGSINGRLMFAAERDGESYHLDQYDLRNAGYLVEPLSRCLVRLGYGPVIRYAHCRGRGDPQHENKPAWTEPRPTDAGREPASGARRSARG
ncbi:zonular occludens toxin domain-containing protein [Thiohalomonas denitrificans]|uniref:Zona occludens toxin, predicted ATPase n=1 Tax=Thiohalomonas denitrificans TaxID=415747 RepID=A0A1G5PU60_9GAMM|nr:zonular occludens toxin domain-containing protein [Thiohalomonas denitrificans]SCZ52948.1 Zona occludens toxin, predicted ATPase [Thiohalomonas denitrificans]